MHSKFPRIPQLRFPCLHVVCNACVNRNVNPFFLPSLGFVAIYSGAYYGILQRADKNYGIDEEKLERNFSWL